MSARAPEDIHKLFTQYFSDGNMEALLSLYEPNAVLLPQPGITSKGIAGIREALSGFLAMNGKLEMAPAKIIKADDIAILFSEWTLSAVGADGNPVLLSGTTADVVRRQADGRWLMVIDSPFGAAGVV